MKYYLIKAREEADVKWVCEKAYRFIYPFGFMPICIELTEEDMGALEIACDSIEAYNKECADKLRKVLENE